MVKAKSDSYPLARDFDGSLRLNLQHSFFVMENGWTLNPKIPISPDMKIAEVGTGTSIWLLDLATRLPETVTLDGFDISDAQFPPKAFLPPNVTLSTLDSLRDVPEHLRGKYDVVHMRLWVLIVKGNDPGPLIRHVRSLLKPGGYIQWEEFHGLGVPGTSEEAQMVRDMLHQMAQDSDINLGWMENITSHLEKEQLAVLEHSYRPVRQALLSVAATLSFATTRELIGNHRLTGRKSPNPSEFEEALVGAMIKYKETEPVFAWHHISLLAQRPMEE